MTMKKSIGTALIVAGLPSFLAGLLLHSVGWLLTGILLLAIGLMFIRRPIPSMNPDFVDSDPSGLAYPAELAYLDDSGDSDKGDCSAGDSAGGDADASSCDFD